MNTRKICWKTTGKHAMSFVVLVGIVLHAVRQTEYHQMRVLLTTLQPRHLLPLVMLQIGTLLITTYLWAGPLSSRDHIRYRGIRHFAEVLRINSAASLMESLTPSSKLGGEGVKLVLLKKYTGMPVHHLTALIVLHKTVVLVPLLVLGVGAMSLIPHGLPIDRLTLAAVLAGVSLVGITAAVSLIPAARHHLQLIFTSCAPYARWSLLLRLFGTATLMWLAYPLKYYIAAGIVQTPVPIHIAILATLASYMVSLLPVSPGGLGTFEITMAHVLQFHGTGFEAGLLIAVTGRLITFWLPLLVSALAAASFLRSPLQAPDYA
ncbi:lysylphosphatidylglycerol synthase transmembrane domain-containing protein [Spirochaeta africana]|uniref:Putative integral membrane protein n=1 Tax=Spirochaeta africana (strain ATCC 700263 / DSM 8902 / Z-7692) TaxID=889378 RepID=H9UHQ9_SPIAZ|nr:lysylphosphatidylglycerol synthase transmembrane domain-containing protein [Spirochaeta africana]AFG37052.1 putative integral membrane protein [Spirochaeta africana DSM 8902]